MAYLPLHRCGIDVWMCNIVRGVLILLTSPLFKICESITYRGVKKFPIWADSSTITPASSSLMFAFSLIVSLIYAVQARCNNVPKEQQLVCVQISTHDL